jgi:hypothetical protein
MTKDEGNAADEHFSAACKKNPQPSYGRLGILPAFTLHSLSLEDFIVKAYPSQVF